MLILKDQDIDVILGMNWLTQHGAIINVLRRTIRVNAPDSKIQLLIQLPFPKSTVETVCATIVEGAKKVSMVCEFTDVFPDDLHGLPPDRDVEFRIDLKPGTALVSRRAYRMPPKELAELKMQL